MIKENKNEIISRVYDWNKSRGLIDKDFDLDLEIGFILEECSEYFKTDNWAVQVDSLIDLAIFSIGAVCKWEKDKEKIIDLMVEDIGEQDDIKTIMIDIQEELIFLQNNSELKDIEPFMIIFDLAIQGLYIMLHNEQNIMDCFGFVLDANDQKGKDTVNGKIVKNDDFVDPCKKIEELIKTRVLM